MLRVDCCPKSPTMAPYGLKVLIKRARSLKKFLTLVTGNSDIRLRRVHNLKTMERTTSTRTNHYCARNPDWFTPL